MGTLLLEIAAAIIGVIALMIYHRQRLKRDVGTIQCNKCHYVGPASIIFLDDRGFSACCARCKGDDWTKIDDG